MFNSLHRRLHPGKSWALFSGTVVQFVDNAHTKFPAGFAEQRKYTQTQV